MYWGMAVMGMEGNLEHCDGGLARGMVPGYGPAMATFHSSFGWALHLSPTLTPCVCRSAHGGGKERIGAERSGASVEIVQLIVGGMKASRHVHKQLQDEQQTRQISPAFIPIRGRDYLPRCMMTRPRNSWA